MKRIIINHDDNVSINEAILTVYEVIKIGRISGINKDIFCYCTTFKDGTHVFANKTKNGTDTFRVERNLK